MRSQELEREGKGGVYSDTSDSFRGSILLFYSRGERGRKKSYRKNIEREKSIFCFELLREKRPSLPYIQRGCGQKRNS